MHRTLHLLHSLLLYQNKDWNCRWKTDQAADVYLARFPRCSEDSEAGRFWDELEGLDAILHRDAELKSVSLSHPVNVADVGASVALEEWRSSYRQRNRAFLVPHHTIRVLASLTS